MNKVLETLWKEILPVSPVFTTAEVAAAASMHLANASRDLAKLEARGMVRRVRRGLWAVPDHPDFSPYAVIPFLFGDPRDGYVSLLSALDLHGLIDQIVRAVQVVTLKRRPTLETPVAVYEFHSIQPELFDGYEPYGQTAMFEIAVPEKALFDVLYLSVHRGRRFGHLPELDLGPGFSVAELERWIGKIPQERIRRAVEDRWTDLVRRQDLHRQVA